MRFWPKRKPATTVIEYFDIPFIGRMDLADGDMSVHTLTGAVCGHWTEIIYRPTTKELFRLECWDGTYSSYQPDNLPFGELPEGTVIGSC